MTVVIDASVATALCLADKGFGLLSEALVAPVLLRSEVLAALQGLQWRREISPELAGIGVERLLSAPVHLLRRNDLLRDARAIAQSLGWAKTYDAEYVAAARLQKAPLLTLDRRLGNRVAALVEVRSPADLTG